MILHFCSSGVDRVESILLRFLVAGRLCRVERHVCLCVRYICCVGLHAMVTINIATERALTPLGPSLFRFCSVMEQLWWHVIRRTPRCHLQLDFVCSAWRETQVENRKPALQSKDIASDNRAFFQIAAWREHGGRPKQARGANHGEAEEGASDARG